MLFVVDYWPAFFYFSSVTWHPLRLLVHSVFETNIPVRHIWTFFVPFEPRIQERSGGTSSLRAIYINAVRWSFVDALQCDWLAARGWWGLGLGRQNINKCPLTVVKTYVILITGANNWHLCIMIYRPTIHDYTCTWQARTALIPGGSESAHGRVTADKVSHALIYRWCTLEPRDLFTLYGCWRWNSTDQS